MTNPPPEFFPGWMETDAKASWALAIEIMRWRLRIVRALAQRGRG